jgi:glycerate kinase
VGATIESGFELIATELDLAAAVETADLVVTGEGFVDEASFHGKVVGGVVELAAEYDVPVLVVAGEVFDGVGERCDAESLVRRFGQDRAVADTLACVTEVVAERLRHPR